MTIKNVKQRLVALLLTYHDVPVTSRFLLNELNASGLPKTDRNDFDVALFRLRDEGYCIEKTSEGFQFLPGGEREG